MNMISRCRDDDMATRDFSDELSIAFSASTMAPAQKYRRRFDLIYSFSMLPRTNEWM